MKELNNSHVSLRRQGLLAVIVWTLIISASLVWDYCQEIHGAYHAAEIEVLATYNKDTFYRRWTSEHGGVYVPMSEQTPANPYLSHIADRDITTDSGKKLTLVNPAYMTRQVHELNAELYSLRGHITSLKPLRPENAPDAWEIESLKQFEKGTTEILSKEMIGGESYMRFMRPFVTEQGCLKCHGHQGYKVGDIRGGISVSIPMKEHLAEAKKHFAKSSIGHGVIWLVGVCGIQLVGQRREKDITHKKAIKLEREELLKALEAKNKEMSEIIYVASHDLKSPLVNIEGFGGELAKVCESIKTVFAEHSENVPEALKQKMSSLIEEASESVDFVVSGTAKMQILINGLLEFSRVGTVSIEMAPLDVEAIFDGIFKTIGYQLEHNNISISRGDLPACMGDAKQINQVFSNLIDNAVKYLDPARDGVINISASTDGERHIYCIEDNGIGISNANQVKIFELFHRLTPDDNVGGEGLGLCIVKHILDRHSGSISVESEPGKGSKFFVSFPKA